VENSVFGVTIDSKILLNKTTGLDMNSDGGNVFKISLQIGEIGLFRIHETLH
jgi:hypothetical protein